MGEPEHIHVTSQFLYWMMTGGVTLLMFVVLFWVKRWINARDRQEEEWLRQGGIVTRERYYAWCEAQKTKCPAIVMAGTLSTWREGMVEKGGPLTKSEHTDLCKEITSEAADRFTEKLEELFKHHREWVSQELKIIQTEQGALSRLVKEQMRTEDGRWVLHDEMKSKSSG